MKYLDEPVEHLARDNRRGGKGAVGRAGVVRGGHERSRGRRGELRDLRCQHRRYGREHGGRKRVYEHLGLRTWCEVATSEGGRSTNHLAPIWLPRRVKKAACAAVIHASDKNDSTAK